MMYSTMLYFLTLSPITMVASGLNGLHPPPLIYFPFILLKVQLKDVEIVVM